MALSAAETREALTRIAAWRADPAKSVACPKCEADGLAVVDRSTRPYAEWYHLACAGCGLDETIHIPPGPPVIGGFD